MISHELAHQWFGNLVTLSWWDDLWLNEGFASYMEYKGVANYHKDWDMESQFLTSDLHRVMNLDATINSHPIVQAVDHPDQITEIFDAISYSKGKGSFTNYVDKRRGHTGISCQNFFHSTIIPSWRVSWVSREAEKLKEL